MIKISTAYKCVHIETYNVTESFSILSASLYLLGMSIFVALLFSFYVYGHEIIFCFGLYWYLTSSYCYFALLTRLTTFGDGFLCKIARVVAIFFCLFFFCCYFHCVKCVRFRSYSGPHFSRIFPHLDWIRRDTISVFSPNAGKCGKMWTRITPNTDSFYAVFTIKIM